MDSKVKTAHRGYAGILALAAATLLTTGCTSGMQSDLDALKTRVGLLEEEVAAANAAAANSATALQTAEDAQASADAAQETADAAMEQAQANNEKIDRMFVRSQSK